MKTTVTASDFLDAFNSIIEGAFSYEALSELFSYLEQCEEATGEELELDVIAICCDFAKTLGNKLPTNSQI